MSNADLAHTIKAALAGEVPLSALDEISPGVGRRIGELLSALKDARPFVQRIAATSPTEPARMRRQIEASRVDARIRAITEPVFGR